MSAVIDNSDGTVFDTTDNTKLHMDYSPLEDSQLVDGVVLSTGCESIAATSKMEYGLWEHPVGISQDVESEEVFVIISGKGKIVLGDGSELELAPGSVGSLKDGAKTRWHVYGPEPLRKVWIMPKKGSN